MNSKNNLLTLLSLSTFVTLSASALAESPKTDNFAFAVKEPQPRNEYTLPQQFEQYSNQPLTPTLQALPAPSTGIGVTPETFNQTEPLGANIPPPSMQIPAAPLPEFSSQQMAASPSCGSCSVNNQPRTNLRKREQFVPATSTAYENNLKKSSHFSGKESILLDKPSQGFSGVVEGGGVISSGYRDMSGAQVNAKLNYSDGNIENRAKVLYDRTLSGEASDNIRIEDQFRIIRDKNTYFYVGLDYAKDPSSGYNKRLTESAGYGLYLSRSKNNTFNIDAGLAYSQNEKRSKSDNEYGVRLNAKYLMPLDEKSRLEAEGFALLATGGSNARLNGSYVYDLTTQTYVRGYLQTEHLISSFSGESNISVGANYGYIF